MAEIRDGKFVRNETNENSMGGTERMCMRLADSIEPSLLEEFQIVCSRVRDLQEDKIRILWFHDLADDPESDFLRDTEEQEKFHKFVFVSNWQMQSYIKKYNLPWSKCVVIQNAIDPIEHVEKPADRINLIYTPTPHRGLNILVPVFDKLCEKHDDIHLDVFSSFDLYGWSERDEPYQALFDTIKNHENMTYHGTQPNEIVREALQSSHIFAYPSIWEETSCLCLMEAMSAGLACVHSNLGALYETASNWTHMYQYHEDINKHAGIFYNVLDVVIDGVREKQFDGRFDTAKQYADIFYSWEYRKNEWSGLLMSLKSTIEDRSLPDESFVYTS